MSDLVDQLFGNSPRSMMLHARKLNKCAKIGFGVFGIVFNFGFWILAITEYLEPAENYITDPNNPNT